MEQRRSVARRRNAASVSYMSVAERQFVRNLERQHAQEELDAIYRARWEARRPDVLAAQRREGMILAWVVGLLAVIAVVAGVGIFWLLVAMGIPVGIAIAIAVLCALPSGGGGCWITVSVFHRH